MASNGQAQAVKDLVQAREAFEEAAAEGGPLIAPVAYLRLGDTLLRMGERRSATEAYTQAATAPESRVRPEAAIRAGECLADEARTDEAEALYLMVAAADPGAAFGLGVLLEAAPDQQEAAVAVYRKGHDVAPDGKQKAALALRLARSMEATDAEVVPLLEQSIADGDDETRTEAQVALAQALIERPQPDDAKVEGLLEAAARSPIVSARQVALLLLAHQLGKVGRRAEAKRLYGQALAEVDPSLASLAAQELGELLDADGEHESAVAMYRSVAARHSLTALSMARALRDQDDGEIAIGLCEIGSDPDGPDPLFAPDASLLLGELLAEHKRIEQAETAYWQALSSSDLTVTPDAAIRLADLRQSLGHPKSETLEAIIAKLDNVSAMTFAQELGPRLSEAGDPDSANSVYRAAGRTDAWTAIQVAAWLADMDEQRTAREVLEFGVEAGGLYGPDAMVRLGDLVVDEDRKRAIDLYRRAATSGDQTVVPIAEQRLAGLP